MSDTQQNITKGKNIVVIQNLGTTNKRINISLSYFSKDFFQDRQYSDLSNPNLVLTSKSIQSCLTPYENLITCDNATTEVSLLINPNNPFTIKIEDSSYTFQNVNEFISNTTLPKDLTRDILQSYIGTPTQECVLSLNNFKPFILEVDNKKFKFYSIEELYQQQDVLKDFNIIFKVLDK